MFILTTYHNCMVRKQNSLLNPSNSITCINVSVVTFVLLKIHSHRNNIFPFRLMWQYHWKSCMIRSLPKLIKYHFLFRLTRSLVVNDWCLKGLYRALAFALKCKTWQATYALGHFKERNSIKNRWHNIIPEKLEISIQNKKAT